LKNSILEHGLETISIELQQLIELKNRLNSQFIYAVEAILDGKGKLVIVGIGKSAHIATKMVATFNSTGTPSQFLHASEAIHGDLGLLQKEDIVIIISNSGNSPEIKSSIPFIKNLSSKIIALTGNKESFLAKESDIILDASVSQEACPNNLAPTSSTTVQMVLGDALAVALMKERNFTDADFANFHPGGNLGKNLFWTVEHLIKNDEKPFVNVESNMKEVILSLSKAKNGITVVLENETIVGVITDGDLRRMLVKYDDFRVLKAKEIMSKNPKTISIFEKASKALEMLKENNIGQLIAVENNQYKGIIDLHQLLEEGIK